MLRRNMGMARIRRRVIRSAGFVDVQAGLEDRETRGIRMPSLADLILNGEPRRGKGGMGGAGDALRIAGRADNVIDGCFFASMPHFDQTPGRAQLFHGFLPGNSATMRRGMFERRYR